MVGIKRRWLDAPFGCVAARSQKTLLTALVFYTLSATLPARWLAACLTDCLTV